MGKPTDKLRAMLDERDIEWTAYEEIFSLVGIDDCYDTRWDSHGVRWSYLEINGKATLSAVGRMEVEFTPEQVIAATLGDEAGWRSVALGLFDSLEKADLEAAQKWITDNNLLRDELAYGDAIIATLGSGKLTAEQVRETVEKHWHDLPAEYDMPEATALPEFSYDWQAIADELNAELGKMVSDACSKNR